MQTAPFRIDAGHHGIHLRSGGATDPLGGDLRAVVFTPADARLLAQAPALLAALQRLMDAPNYGTHAAMRRARENAQQVIDAAKED